MNYLWIERDLEEPHPHYEFMRGVVTISTDQIVQDVQLFPPGFMAWKDWMRGDRAVAKCNNKR